MEGIKMKAKLDNFEKEIENNAESYKSISKGKKIGRASCRERV